MMICFLLIWVLSVFSAPMVNAEDIKLSDGQTVYVPIYSHIYSGIKARPFDLAATLSIRNTDPTHAITLVAVPTMTQMENCSRSISVNRQR